jgi:hypothetical protein
LKVSHFSAPTKEQVESFAWRERIWREAAVCRPFA